MMAKQVLYVGENIGKEYDFKLEVWDYKYQPKNVVCGVYDNYGAYGDEKTNQLWAMKRATNLKKEYDEFDVAYEENIKKMEALQDGDLVYIVHEDEPERTGYYKIEVKGDYSDACLFKKVANMK